MSPKSKHPFNLGDTILEDTEYWAVLTPDGVIQDLTGSAENTMSRLLDRMYGDTSRPWTDAFRLGFQLVMVKTSHTVIGAYQPYLG